MHCMYALFHNLLFFTASVPYQEEEFEPDDLSPSHPHIEILRGRDGRDGRDGLPGPRGPPGTNGASGKKGMTGARGKQGPPGPSSGGVTYVRWGRTTCPNTMDTELVYAGRAAGGLKENTGGTSDILCLPEQPEYMNFTQDLAARSTINGVEYQTNYDQPLYDVYEQNVPCVICHATQRESSLMIPARISCPDTWTLEYSGYLMTAHDSEKGRQSATCVDKDPKTVPGEADHTRGTRFQHIKATCNGIQCPPYDSQKELTCTK